MPHKKSKPDFAAAKAARILKAHLENLPDKDARVMREEIHALAVKGFHSTDREKASRTPRNRIMYIGNKSAGLPGEKGLIGPARIGRVTFNRTRKTLYYKGKAFQSLRGRGFKANYFDVETHEEYWISGPRKDGADGLYGPRPTPIDDDVRLEYWTVIRKNPGKKDQRTT